MIRRLTQLVLMCTLATPVAAQREGGRIGGVVREAGTGTPIADARVAASIAADTMASVRTAGDGRYVLDGLAPGRYTVSVARIGYAPFTAVVTLETGAAVTLDVDLRASASRLTAVVTSASRVAEQIVDAPASVSVVSEREIEERPALSTTDHLRSTPGLDISQGGLVQANVTARGFNNIFSGTLLMLQDHRIASVPSLRVNVPYLLTSSGEDIERIEVVLGPGSALYGPNASNGVLHILTKSPIDAPGSSIAVDAGTRSTFRIAGRTAYALSDRWGVKLSGEYLRGEEWEYRDPAEPATVLRPTGPGLRDTVVNDRDFDVARAVGEARVDFRPAPGSEVVASYGLARAIDAIELTAANGAAQVRDWTYQHGQLRGRHRGFFGQLFVNASHAGNEDSLDTEGTYLLRTGQPIVDKSRVWGAQAQQSLNYGGVRGVVGLDWIQTIPQTEGTINGGNEDDDNVTEVGGYGHAQFALAPRWDLIGALRLDTHSELEGTFVSPRAALVFRPADRHQIRATWNRAFQTPGNFQFFLDLRQGVLGPLPYGIRAVGNPSDGYTFSHDCAGGVDGLCMRVPSVLAPGAGALPAEASSRFQDAVTIAQSQLSPSLVGVMRTMSPTASDISTTLRFFDPFLLGFSGPVSPSIVQDVDPLEASHTTVYEIGYKGLVFDRLGLALDAWYERRRNFIAAAANLTPNVFMDPATLQAYLAAEFAARGVPNPAATAAAVAPALAQIPVGTVVPDHPRADDNELLFTYQNIRRTIDLQGLDGSAELLLTDRLSLEGTYSWMSDVIFPDVPNGLRPLALNAPPSKGTFTVRWRQELGWSGEARWRYVNTFPVNSGVYVGTAPVNERLDALVAYRWRTGRGTYLAALSGTNLLDRRVPSLVGTAPIGRMVMGRVQVAY